MKASVTEAKLTGLWAASRATIQQVLISKFAFGPGTFEKRAQGRISSITDKMN